MPKAKVSSPGMQDEAREVFNEIDLLAQSFKRVSENLNGLLQYTWEGQDKTAFFKKFEQDAQFFEAHIQSLKSVNERLNEAIRIYMNAEDEVKQVVGGIRTI